MSDSPVDRRKLFHTAGLLVSGVAVAASASANASNAKVVRVVSDYNELESLGSNDVGVGDIVKVSDEGIAGDFLIQTGSSSRNFGTIFNLHDGLFAKRIYDGPINVKWFGVKGDGETDDTTWIQQTLNAHEGSPCEIYFPPGTYIVSRKIDIVDSFKFLGSGIGSTTIMLDADAPERTAIFDTIGRDKVQFSDMTLDGNSENQNSFNGGADNGQSGIIVRESADVLITNIHFKNLSKDGIFIFHGENGIRSKRTNIHACIFEAIRREGVTIISGEQISITGSSFFGRPPNNNFVHNGGIIWEADPRTDGVVDDLDGLIISDNSFSDMEAGIILTNQRDVNVEKIKGIIITNNNFRSIHRQAAIVAYRLGNNGITISNNRFQHCGTVLPNAYSDAGAIMFSGTDNAIISDNNFLSCNGNYATIYSDSSKCDTSVSDCNPGIGDFGNCFSQIKNNRFDHDKKCGIFLQGPDSAKVQGGTFRHIIGNIMLNGGKANRYDEDYSPYCAIYVSNLANDGQAYGYDLISNNTIQTSSTDGYAIGVKVHADDGNSVLDQNKITGDGEAFVFLDCHLNDLSYEHTSSGIGTCSGALSGSVAYEITKHANLVNLRIPGMHGTTNGEDFIQLGINLPERFRPNATLYQFCLVQVDGQLQASPGLVQIGSDGVIRIFRDGSRPSWGTAAATGFAEMSFSFTV